MDVTVGWGLWMKEIQFTEDTQNTSRIMWGHWLVLLPLRTDVMEGDSK